MTDKVLDGDNFEVQRTKINQQVDLKGQLTAIGGKLKVAQGPRQERLTEAVTVGMTATELNYSNEGDLIVVTSIPGGVIESIEPKNTYQVITIRFETFGQITSRVGNIILPTIYGTDGDATGLINVAPDMELTFLEIPLTISTSEFHFIGSNVPEKFNFGWEESTLSGTGSFTITVNNNYNILDLTADADRIFTGFENLVEWDTATHRGEAQYLVINNASEPVIVQHSSTLQLPEAKDFIAYPGDVLVFLEIDASTDNFILLGKSSIQGEPSKVVLIEDGELRRVYSATYEPLFAGKVTIKYNYESSYIEGPTQIRIPNGVTKARFGVLVYAPSTTELDTHSYSFRLLRNYAKFMPEDVGTLGETVAVGNKTGTYIARGSSWTNTTGGSVSPVYFHVHIDSIVGSLAAAGDLNIYILGALGSYYQPTAIQLGSYTIPNADISPGIYTFQASIGAIADEGQFGIVVDFVNDPGAGNYIKITAAHAEPNTSETIPSDIGHFIGNENFYYGDNVRYVRYAVHGATSVDNNWIISLDGEDSFYPIWVAFQEFNSTQTVILSETTFGSELNPEHHLLMTTPAILVSEGDTYSLEAWFAGEPDGNDPENQIKEFWMEIIE